MTEESPVPGWHFVVTKFGHHEWDGAAISRTAPDGTKYRRAVRFEGDNLKGAVAMLKQWAAETEARVPFA